MVAISQAASALEFVGSPKPLVHYARMDDKTPQFTAPYRCMQRAPDMRSIVPQLTAETSTSTYVFNRSLYHFHEAMKAPTTTRSLVVGAALTMAVAVALSSPWFTKTAAARPLPYAAGRSSQTSTSTSLDCATVTSLLAGCKAFVRRGALASSPTVPAPGAACCEGVAELYAVASDSADNWRSVCGCMAGLVRRYPSNASAIALLPVLCAVLPPAGRRAAGDTLTYCTSPS